MSKTQVFLSIFWIIDKFRQILQHMDSNFLDRMPGIWYNQTRETGRDVL